MSEATCQKFAINPYRVEVSSVRGGIEVTSGVITNADPVLMKFLGARLDRFRIWVERKGGTVRRLSQARERV